ncbi:MAG TPA: hypothetical protein DCS38_00490 [Ruminococcus sp.]|nr:hypothetical protein [Ruminococcus sp.]HBN11534.1 hypothetical protein [Ruminococcus sp.]HCR73853.1 hypothetical protein [Ruminococcus sp.]
MMTGEIAKVYADALFELCSEDKSYDSVHRDINDCRKVFADNPDLLKFLSAPAINTDKKTELLSEIFSDCGIVCNLLCVITVKNRAGLIYKITDCFNKLYNEYKNIAEITVTTCIPLSDTMREKLKAKLSAKFGKTVVMNEKVDKSILGGVIVQYENLQIDSSIKSKLNSVHNELIS